MKNNFFSSQTLHFFLAFLCFFPITLSAQKTSNILSNTSILIGSNLHETIPFVGTLGKGYRYTIITPEIGIAYEFDKVPLSLSYRKTINNGTGANEKILFNSTDESSDFEEIDEFNIYYHLSKNKLNFRPGIGYYHKRWITPGYHWARNENIFESEFEYKGITLSFAFDLKQVNIEFKKYLNIYRGFAVFEPYLYSISVNRYFSLVQKNEPTTTEYSRWDRFFPYISIRVQPIKYFQQNPNLFNRIGFVPGIGIGYDFPDQNIAITLNREVWKRQTGGTLTADIIGYVSTTNLMIKKYWQTKKEHNLFVGVGWHLIRNENESPRIIETTVTDDFTGQEVPVTFQRFVNIAGIGASFGYQLNDNYEIELRHIFPYMGDDFLNPYYLSLCVSYFWRE